MNGVVEEARRVGNSAGNVEQSACCDTPIVPRAVHWRGRSRGPAGVSEDRVVAAADFDRKPDKMAGPR